MRKKTGTSQPGGTNLLARDVPLGHFKRRKQPKTDKTAGRKSNPHFLNRVFRPFPAIRISPLFTDENFDYLYRSARNYSNLLGSSFDFQQNGSDFLKLFHCFEKLLPEGQELLLIEQEKKLSFKVWFGYDFLIGEIFFIPIEILNKTEGKFRDILLSFFQLFQSVHRFAKKEDLFDYEMVMDCYFGDWYNDRDDDPNVETFLKAYKDGYVHDTFSLIYQPPNRSTEELTALIEHYTPKNKSESNLLATVKQGINILGMKKNIFNYSQLPKRDDDDLFDVDDGFIEAERMIRFVYSGNDYVSKSYVEYLNGEIQMVDSEYFPRQSLVVTPETDGLLEVDFVECFFTWLSRFINNLYKYENLYTQ